MRSTRRPALLLLVLTAVGGGPVASASASAKDILKDCQINGTVTGTYSQKDYADALRNIPTDIDEYSDCRDIIRRARLGSAAGSSAGGGSSGDAGGVSGSGGATGSGVGGDANGSGGVGGDPGVPGTPAAENAGKKVEQVLDSASPAERAQVSQAQQAGAPVQLGGRVVSPATSGLSPAGAANVVPTPLVAALVLLGLGLAAAAAQLIRSRLLARRVPGS